jgi:VWFA-related protein
MVLNRPAIVFGAALLLSLASLRIEAEDAKPKQAPVAPGVQRERVNLVLIDIVVTDRKGRRIDDLRPDEFSLKVDGKPHPIDSVELLWSAGALEAGPSPASGKETPSGVGSLPRQQSNRRFVFLLDALNCERGLALAPIDAVRKFLQKGLPAGDEVMITGLGRDFKIYQEFTSDRAKLLSALDAIESDTGMRNGGENRVRQNIVRLQEEKDNSVDPARGPKRFSAIDQERAVQRVATTFADEDERRSRRTLATLRALVSYLHSSLAQRKELFFLTDGFFSDPNAFYGTPGTSSRGHGEFSSVLEVSETGRLDAEVLRLSREAAAAQVTIHTINTQGVTRGAIPGLRSAPETNRNWEQLIESEASNTLANFALGTGGTAYHGNDDFMAPLVKVEQETRATYRLTYVPSGDPDGSFHATKVEVLRKGLRVRAKEGFLYLTEDQVQERQLLAAHL